MQRVITVIQLIHDGLHHRLSGGPCGCDLYNCILAPLPFVTQGLCCVGHTAIFVSHLKVMVYYVWLFPQLDSWEFNIHFRHKYGYIRDERSGVESYPYPVKESQRYVNINTDHLFYSAVI